MYDCSTGSINEQKQSKQAEINETSLIIQKNVGGNKQAC